MRFEISKSYEYIENLIPKENINIAKAREASALLGLDKISLSAVEMSIIRLFVKMIQPQKLLEIGCLTGASALHLLEDMPPNSHLTTIEKSVEHSAKAMISLKDPISKGRCDLIVGDARQVLSEKLVSHNFDFILIDANKAAYLEYYQWSLQHLNPKGLIIVDNIFLSGAVWGQETQQNFNAKQIDQVQKMNQLAFSDTSVKSSIIPTAEGLLLSFKI